MKPEYVTQFLGPDPRDWHAAVPRAWEELAAASRSLYALYQSPPWWEHLVATSDPRGLHLGVVAAKSGEIVGIAPLSREPCRLEFGGGGHTLLKIRLRSLALLGSEALAAEGHDIHAALFESLWKSFPDAPCVYLKHVPRTGPLWSYFERSAWKHDRWVVHRESRQRPFHSVLLPPTFAEYLDKFTAKKRYNLKRQLKLLQDHAAGRLRLVRIETEAETREFLAAVGSISQASWQDRALGRREDFGPENLPGFLDLARRGLLRCYVLECGGEYCAFAVGYLFRGVFHYSDVGYDARFARFSPGVTLLYLLLEDLIESKSAHAVNFGIGDSEYKRNFGNEHGEDTSVLLLRKTLANQLLSTSHGLFVRAKGLHGLARLSRGPRLV